jgi:uncharacterized protein YjbJ (UPF0337 family)
MEMATEDKAANKAKELKGRAEEIAGDVTDDEELKAQGRSNRAKGNIKQAGEKMKDAFKK